MTVIYIILGLVLILFWVLMLMDVMNNQMPQNEKNIWLAIMAVPVLLGIILYLIEGWLIVPLFLLALGAFSYYFIKRGK